MAGFNVSGLHSHGYCKAAKDANLYYALFGSGPVKIIMIMGFATSGLAWKNQIEYLVQFPQYQVCVFDNRGAGNTFTPPGRLTTSLMAEDVILLLNHLSWDHVHIVGQSLGGMIAQELALAIPHKVSSLTLIATHAGGWRAYIPPWKAMLSMLRHPFVKTPKDQTRVMIETVFSRQYLSLPGKKEHCSIISGEYTTVLDFYVESLLSQFGGIFVKKNPFYMLGQQLSAILTHRVARNRLCALKGKFPVLLMVGTGDKIVHPAHTDHLYTVLGGNLMKFDGAGHAVTEECLDKVNTALHQHFTRTQAL